MEAATKGYTWEAAMHSMRVAADRARSIEHLEYRIKTLLGEQEAQVQEVSNLYKRTRAFRSAVLRIVEEHTDKAEMIQMIKDLP